MKIVGLSFGSHDSSYAIIENGNLTIHEELERHSRIKECNGDVVDFYINRQGSFDDVDVVCYFPHANKDWYPDKFSILEDLSERGEIKLIEVGHHESHAANAFFSSNFSESLIVTIDGGGWDRTKDGMIASRWTVWKGKDNKIQPLEYRGDWNPGAAWQEVTTKIFGMCGGGPPMGCQAGTVMAMAAMGNEDRFYDDILTKGNIFGAQPVFPWGDYASLDEQGKFDFAASFQKATEEIVRKELSVWIKEDTKYLCLSGGTVLNSVMTGKIWDWFPQLEDIYIPPVPYDAGLAIGCAQYVLHQIQNEPRVIWDDNATPYLGVTYSKSDVVSALENNKEKVKHQEANVEEVCRLIADEKIVSVYGGGSESGRRALGNRSILADPTNPNMKDIVNEKVKHRQWFRPFAPSIMREEVSNWFTRDVNSPYMGFVLKFKEEQKDKVPAVVHLDGSARLQTVTEKDNKWYYSFLKTWQKISKVPIILNTSFNDREPIVEKPEHAINCYLGTNIDYLYFYDYNILVSKK